MRDRVSLSSKWHLATCGLMLLVLFCAPIGRANAGLPRVLPIEDPIRQRSFESDTQQLAESPEDPRLLERQAKLVYLEMRDVAAAREYFELAIAQYDKQPAVLQVFTLDARMGYAYLLEKYYEDYEAAARVYERVIAINPDHPMGYLPLAALYEKHRNDPERAESLLQMAVKLHDDSIPLIEYSRFLARAKSDCVAAEGVLSAPIERVKDRDGALDYVLPLMLERATIVATCTKDFERADRLFQEYFEANTIGIRPAALQAYADLYDAWGKEDSAVEREYLRHGRMTEWGQVSYCEYLASRGLVDSAREWLDHVFEDRDRFIIGNGYNRYRRARPWVLAYLLRKGEGRAEALHHLRLDVESGHRYPVDGVHRLAAIAKRLGDPEAEGIELLARVLADEEDESLLDQWPAWRKACSPPGTARP